MGQGNLAPTTLTSPTRNFTSVRFKNAWTCWATGLAATRTELWSAFYAKAAVPDHFCLPVLLHCCPRWPANKSLADRVDATQRKVMTILLRTPPLPQEPPERYAARKSMIAATIIRQWFSRVSRWNSHNERHAENLTSKLLAWQGEDYLTNLRQPFVPRNPLASRGFTLLGGRLETRRQPGRPPTRWADGVKYAEYELKLEKAAAR